MSDSLVKQSLIHVFEAHHTYESETMKYFMKASHISYLYHAIEYDI